MSNRRYPDTLLVRLLAVVVLIPALFACQPAPADPAGAADPVEVASGPVEASGGMVSAAHPAAAAAGVEVLAAGGNAFDAAVVVAAALTVVEPASSNLFGGYGSVILHDSKSGETRYLDNNGRFPLAVDADVFRAAPELEAMMRTAQAVSTPGNLAGFEQLWQEHGSRPWKELFATPIRLAEEGFEVSPRLARGIADAWEHFSEYTREIYGRDGAPLGDGERLVQSDLAAALSLAAEEGAAALYDGALGEAIVAEMERRGGFLAQADLAAHRSEWLPPIAIDYRDVRVLTAGPPSNSFAALVCLGIMSRHDLSALEHNSGRYLHRFAEATKHAFWARRQWAGGPEENPPPLERLLSPQYWQLQADALDPERASRFVPPGAAAAEAESTTHFVVADRSGNVVSATLTLGHGFGSGVMAEGVGIWLNNSLAYSSFEPAGNPMDALPGRRKHSSKTPTLILRDGRPWVAIGTPGGHTIPQTVPQMVINLVDFEMDLKAAVDAPRVAFAEPDRLQVGEGIPDGVLAELEALGHRLQARRGIGNAHALAIEYGADGLPTRFLGAADRRGEGAALGVD